MNCDELIAALDEQHKPDGWDLWRTALQSWCVRIRRGNYIASRDTLQEALEEALTGVRPKIVPRRPRAFTAPECNPSKSGSKWYLELPTGGTIFNQPSRKVCWQHAERLADYSQKAAEKWDQEWRPVVESGVEGEDWIYA